MFLMMLGTAPAPPGSASAAPQSARQSRPVPQAERREGEPARPRPALCGRTLNTIDRNTGSLYRCGKRT